MANINVSEADFAAVAAGANYAQEHGDMETAATLDKLARKINAKLSNASVPAALKWGAEPSAPLTWRDMPSTLVVP